MSAVSTSNERTDLAKRIVEEFKRSLGGKRLQVAKITPALQERWINFAANAYCMQTIKLKKECNLPWTRIDAERELASVKLLMNDVFSELMNVSSNEAVHT